ncbi:MAG: hypothetical protein U5N56_10580 [Candidatus Marinimicrobia bacterium]|nr:hypothetical protein [Candidatus Neomarinimicrobiota bacterium]
MTADLNERMMVGTEPGTGFPKRSIVDAGSRRAVSLPIPAILPYSDVLLCHQAILVKIH